MLAAIATAALRELTKKTFEAIARSYIDSVASTKPRSWASVESALPMAIANIANTIADDWTVPKLREKLLKEDDPTMASTALVAATRIAMRSAPRNQFLATITTWSNHQVETDERRAARLTVWVDFKADGSYVIQRSVLEGAGDSIVDGLISPVLSGDQGPDGNGVSTALKLEELINTPNPPDIVVEDGVGPEFVYSRSKGGIVTPRGTLLANRIGRWGVKAHGTGIEPFVYAHIFVSEVLGAMNFSQLKLQGH